MTLIAALSSLSILTGLTVSGFLVMNFANGRQASQQLVLTQALADQEARRAWAVGRLAERLQQASPVTADELARLAPNVLIEDEGGKISLSASAFALPTALVSARFVSGLAAADPLTRKFAETWGLQLGVTAGGMPYPVEDRRKARVPMESVKEVMAGLEFPEEEILRAGQVFTVCEILGLNVNTADVKCLEGVLNWQQASAKTWMEPPVEAIVDGTTVQFMPLPSQEPLIWIAGNPLVARRPQEILSTTLPELFPLEAFNPLWNLFQVAQISSINLPWIVGTRRIRFDGQDQAVPASYARPFTVKPAPWFRWMSVVFADAVVAHRPYTPSELTQPLGLGWVTPESWFMPVMPSVAGAFDGPTDLNVALGAAAFTGWLSLQGPGPYRATSEWYTVVVSGSPHAGSYATRTTLRVLPGQPPLVAAFEEER